eukprot:2824953-Pleurochrysis_carterae.AAC.1
MEKANATPAAPSSNESHVPLSSKGLLNQLLCIKYGRTDDELEATSAVLDESDEEGASRHQAH